MPTYNFVCPTTRRLAATGPMEIPRVANGEAVHIRCLECAEEHDVIRDGLWQNARSWIAGPVTGPTPCYRRQVGVKASVTGIRYESQFRFGAQRATVSFVVTLSTKHDLARVSSEPEERLRRAIEDYIQRRLEQLWEPRDGEVVRLSAGDLRIND